MLRAIAALFVVLHHFYPHYQAMGGTLAPINFLSAWGFLGVDIFFVISGFIMAFTTFEKERTFDNAKRFFKHRLFRIYLGYWPFFFMMLLLMGVKNPQKLSELDILGSFFLTNANMFQLLLPVSWSLSFELYFYSLFLFTFLFSKKLLYWILPVFMALLCFVILFIHFQPQISPSFFYSPFLLEFFAGVALYMYRNYLMKLWIFALGMLIAVIVYCYGIELDARNGLLRVATFGTGAFFVILCALIAENKNIFHAGRWIEAVGNASFAIYLSHLLFIELFYIFGLRDLFSSTHEFMPLAGLLVVVSAITLFSHFYYQKVERPIYQKAIGEQKK